MSTDPTPTPTTAAPPIPRFHGSLDKTREWARMALGPWAEDIAAYIREYRYRRPAVPIERVVISDDGLPYIRALGDMAGAERITCPSLDVAYVVHDALVIADTLLARGGALPAIPAGLRGLLEALVAAQDHYEAMTRDWLVREDGAERAASDAVMAAAVVKVTRAQRDLVAWARSHSER